MTVSSAPFDQFAATLAEKGIDPALECLAEQLRRERQFRQLFEARRMQIRHRLGLPLDYDDGGDELPEETRRQLEDGLFAACREVGLLMLAAGRIREGWMYLQPVGDRALVAAELAKLEVDEDNLEEMIEVCLNQGVDPVRGFSLVLEHFGTCNAITTFEGGLPTRSLEEMEQALEMIVRHVHGELLEAVKNDIARQEGARPSEPTLTELVAERPWLFAEHSYHIDATHLAATVRFARATSRPHLVRLARDLCEYGRRLNAQFQYRGDEPFEDFYPQHALFFDALLGENVEQAVEYFRGRAEETDPTQQPTVNIEVYIDLLARLGRYEEAIETTLRLMPGDRAPLGFAPTLAELCRKSGAYSRFSEVCRERNDLLGFADGLIRGRLAEQG